MFEGFEKRSVNTDNDAVINLVKSGDGPPLLLLHGYPQTHVIWHKIAPRLAENFTVIATDLRGYGDSSKPPGDPQHLNYSKRMMAQDQVDVMAKLGFQEFFVVGHDRGGRVAHRMAIDHRDRVKKLVVLDIAPTYTMYMTTDKEFASAYYHWFFLIQPYNFPETLIGANPEYFLRAKISGAASNPAAITQEAMAEYIRCFSDPATIYGSCEDYRASASIDLIHDEADMFQKIICPLLVVWGKMGLVGRKYDVLETWRERATDVRGFPLVCGHYLPEEAPDETYQALREFLL